MSSNIPTTIEAQYVAKTVGPALSKGLAEILEMRPEDPVEYLAHYLYKYIENTNNKKKDLEDLELIKRLREEKEIEERRAEELKREAEAFKAYEVEMQKLKELENRRKKELDELAKRKEEMASRQPPMMSLLEEEDNIVDFGNTKLHEMAGVDGANLTKMLKENFNLAVRNSEFKTARDIAVERKLTENVRQIDLFSQENFKALTDLLVLGFDDIIHIIEAKHGNAEKMKQKEMETQAEYIYNVFPRIQAKIKDIIISIENNDVNTLKSLMDKKYLGYYRDDQGRSPLIHAIQKQNLEIAAFLIEKFPFLLKINDAFEKTPSDYFVQLDQTNIDSNNIAWYQLINNEFMKSSK